MAKTLYLHVGMPKCASTTIQDVLKAHAEVFAQAGRFYGIPPGDHTVGQGNATRLLADIRAERTERVDRAMGFFLERDSDVILSSEILIGLARNRMSDALIARAARAGFGLRILCYVRRQDDWIESDYRQHIKGGSDWVQDIRPLIARRLATRVLDYHWLLENWTRSAARSQITVVPLGPGQGEHYALERFLAFLGMDPARAPGLALGRSNVSPPGALVEPMRHLKIALLARGVPVDEVPVHLERFIEAAPGLIALPPRRHVLAPAERRALLARCAESNARLAADYLGGMAAFDPPADTQDEGAAPQDLDAEAATVLARWIVACAARGDSPGAAGVPWRRVLTRSWWQRRRAARQDGL